jgi:hypothetical protein
MNPQTVEVRMSTEFVLWSLLGVYGAVGGILLLAALWSLVRRPRGS